MLAGVALFIVSSVLLWEFGRDRLLETLAGLGFLLMVLAPVGGVWVSRLGRLGALAYGIYFSHLLFIKVGEAASMKLALTPGPALELAIWLFTLAGSAALAWMLA
jgi:surface polysaccharide O-acyltransferase-like enzyme